MKGKMNERLTLLTIFVLEYLRQAQKSGIITIDLDEKNLDIMIDLFRKDAIIKNNEFFD